MLGVGVIGCGAIATAVHLRVLAALPGVRVTALADPDPAARRRGLALARRAAACTDAAGLLARDDVEAVVVTAPSGVHATLALQVLAARRHLYLEKPVATSVAAARAVAAAAREAGTVGAAGFNWRFQPLVLRAHELLRDGVIGAIRSIATTFAEPGAVPEWKSRRANGGGVLLDLGSHHFDLVRWLSGAEMTGVAASVRSAETEHDEATVRLQLDRDIEVTSFFSLRAPRAHRVDIAGERGTLRLDRSARTLAVEGVRARTTSRAILAWRARCLIRPLSEPSWRYALAAWVDAIRGAERTLPTIADGVRALEIVAAAERAAGV